MGVTTACQRLLAIAVVALLLATLAGCAQPVASLFPPPPGDEHPVFVVRHGWHTRIALRLADVDAAVWPESRAFGDVDFIEVGWGDYDFYQTDGASIAQAARAALTPTAAALHVGGLEAPLDAAVGGRELIRVDVSARGLHRLVRYVAAAFDRDDSGRAIRTRPGRYPQSSFYEATGTYHLANNSNHWTARALREAGVPITPSYAVTASNVMFQARRVGRSSP